MNMKSIPNPLDTTRGRHITRGVKEKSGDKSCEVCTVNNYTVLKIEVSRVYTTDPMRRGRGAGGEKKKKKKTDLNLL